MILPNLVSRTRYRGELGAKRWSVLTTHPAMAEKRRFRHSNSADNLSGHTKR